MFKFTDILKRFIPPYKKYVFLSLLFNLISTFFSLFSFGAIMPILNILFKVTKEKPHIYQPWTWNNSFGDIIKALINNVSYSLEQMIHRWGNQNALIYIGIFLIVMTLLKVGTSYLGSYFVIPIRTGVLRDLRNQLYRKILDLPIAFFSNERKGDIMTRMTSDVVEVEASVISSVDMVLKNPIMIFIYLVTLFVISWQLTLFVLIFLPASSWLIGKIGKSLKKRSRLGQEQTSDLLSQIEETLGGLRVIKTFNAEEKAYSLFSELNNKLRRTLARINRRINMAHPISELLGTMIIAILLWFGGFLILGKNSSISAAEFIFYLVMFYNIIPPSKELSRATYSIQRGMASLDRIDMILMTENNILDPENPEKIPTEIKLVETKHLSFKYDTDWILRDINMVLPHGKTIAMVGQSGSGKSTLVDLFPRFYDVVEGEILLNGINIKNFSKHDLRSTIASVHQDAVLFNDTFFNNIAFGNENATLEQVVEAAKIANAHDFIMAAENGYETYIGDAGSKISGGQRQRISIARAILKNPSILILDEATSALDTESEFMVQEALDKLMKNRTTLVVAHRLSTIKKADLIYVLHEGKIVEQGKHDELIALKGYYKKLVDMQSF